MGRKKDIVRKYFIQVVSNDNRQSCKFYLKECNMNMNKMKAHLGTQMLTLPAQHIKIKFCTNTTLRTSSNENIDSTY